MAEDGFYEKSDSNITIEKYNASKAKATELLAEWEKIASQLEG